MRPKLIVSLLRCATIKGQISLANHFSNCKRSITSSSPTHWSTTTQSRRKSVIMELERDPSDNFIEEEKLVLIDTDGGTDDAWAIFLCLAAHRNQSIPFRVVGITCTHGNTNVDNVTMNVTRILDTVNETNIPIFRGSESALVFPLEQPEDPYHGHDGFGDANLPRIQPALEAEHGVNAIIQMAEMYKGNLSILALGPLTNLAMAVRLRPAIKNMIKEIYILGGNHQAVGNTTVLGEFNFLADAEAAHIVLDNFCFSCPMYVIPWETCLRATSDYKFRVDVLGKLKTKEMSLLNKIEKNMLQKFTDNWMAADAIAAAVLIESSLTTKSDNYHCTVELHGKHSRGMMVVDKNFLMQKPSNCTLIQKVDRTLLEKMLVWAAGGPLYDNPNKNLGKQKIVKKTEEERKNAGILKH